MVNLPGSVKRGATLTMDISGLAHRSPEGFTVTTEANPPLVYQFVRVEPLLTPRQIDGKWEQVNHLAWNKETHKAYGGYWTSQPVGGAVFHLRAGERANDSVLSKDCNWVQYVGTLDGGTGSFDDPLRPGQRSNIQFSRDLMVFTALGDPKQGSCSVHRRTLMPPTEVPENTGGVRASAPYMVCGPWGAFPAILDLDTGTIDALFAKGKYSSNVSKDMYIQMGQGEMMRGVSWGGGPKSYDYFMLKDGIRNRRGPEDVQASLLKLFPITEAHLVGMRGPKVLTCMATFPPNGQPTVKRNLAVGGTMDRAGVMTWQNGRKQQLLKPADQQGRFSFVGANRQEERYVAYCHNLFGHYIIVCRVDDAGNWLRYWMFRNPADLKSGQ